MQTKNVTKKIIESVVVIADGIITISHTYDDKSVSEMVYNNPYITEDVAVTINGEDKKPIAKEIIVATQYKPDYIVALQDSGLLHQDTGKNVLNVKWKTNQQDAKRKDMQAVLDGKPETAEIKTALKNPIKSALILKQLNGETLTADELLTLRTK